MRSYAAEASQVKYVGLQNSKLWPRAVTMTRMSGLELMSHRVIDESRVLRVSIHVVSKLGMIENTPSYGATNIETGLSKSIFP